MNKTLKERLEVFPLRIQDSPPFVSEEGENVTTLITQTEQEICTMLNPTAKTLIVDIPLSTNQKEAFRSQGLNLLTPSALSENILSWPEWEEFNPSTTLLLFPGNGAQILKDSLPPEWINSWPNQKEVGVKRVWFPGENPRVIGGSINTPSLQTGIKNVIILDDALSSGATARQLKSQNEMWFPQAAWTMVTWVRQKQASLKDFKTIYAAATVGTQDKKAPLNSLSTMVENPEIAFSYASRNYQRPQEFLSVLGLTGKETESIKISFRDTTAQR